MTEICNECGVSVDDGEGCDGMCGNCADKAEAEYAASGYADNVPPDDFDDPHYAGIE